MVFHGFKDHCRGGRESGTASETVIDNTGHADRLVPATAFVQSAQLFPRTIPQEPDSDTGSQDVRAVDNGRDPNFDGSIDGYDFGGDDVDEHGQFGGGIGVLCDFTGEFEIVGDDASQELNALEFVVGELVHIFDEIHMHI